MNFCVALNYISQPFVSFLVQTCSKTNKIYNNTTFTWDPCFNGLHFISYALGRRHFRT